MLELPIARRMDDIVASMGTKNFNPVEKERAEKGALRFAIPWQTTAVHANRTVLGLGSPQWGDSGMPRWTGTEHIRDNVYEESKDWITLVQAVERPHSLLVWITI
ncbi:hypothetical protein Taro_048920 [Colocasia esculenta]|uniref:Uncharacterized protein n=1 Tax=Colocasia esculenta TaxID=4460 RepID=A0A843X9F8_COLES|nr:hypothetical protein [Colocasia esculenta]